MSTLSTVPKKTVKLLSGRKRVNGKILRFSLLIGTVASFLTAFVYIATVLPAIHHAQEINLRTLSEINCMDATCDASIFLADWQLGDSNYIIDTQTGYFINIPTSGVENSWHFPPFDSSDIGFIAGFRQPTTYTAPYGEDWRLYSERVDVNGRQFEVIVGYAVKAAWKMIDTPSSMMGIVDTTLRREADKIATNLPKQKGMERVTKPVLSVDGFEIVDANTGEVFDWGPPIPVRLPKSARLPTPGCCKFHRSDSDLYFVQTDVKGQLLATAFVPIGSIWWLLGFCGTAFFCTSVVARFLSYKFLRTYFALTGKQAPTLDEALRNGEGQNVEFKGGLSDEVLKSIAAFANTNDGIIFLGVTDVGHVKGLNLDFKQRDILEQKIRELVRNQIKPAPPFQVEFEDVRGFIVCKITVARGDAPVYMIAGVIYVRFGSTDIQAQPHDLTRLFNEYAS